MSQISLIATRRRYKTRTMLEAKGKITNKGNERYPKIFIYVPAGVAKDSAFPFDWQRGEDVLVRIDRENNRLIIEKLREG